MKIAHDVIFNLQNTFEMQAKQLLLPLLLWGTMAQAKDNSPSITDNKQLHFIENQGQIVDQYGNTRSDINYRLGGSGLSMFVGKGQLHYQWASPVARLEGDKQQVAMYRMDVTLIGSDPQAKVVAEQMQPYFERYYTPQFGEQGGTAYAYQKITYQNVYPHIDWVLYVKGDKVEYDFIVRPGGKVSDIQLQYGGATNLALNDNGSLTATTPSGSITEAAPVSYQQADGKHISSFFTLNGNKVSFTTNDYTGTLVIDPTLSWSTYYGGTADDQSYNNSLSGDNNGNVYSGGYTQSTSNIATSGSYKDTLTGAYDAFLVKFNSIGVRQWAAYYGGSNTETVYGVVCDKNDKVYLSGYTNSPTGIATTGSYKTVLGTTGSGTDAFLAQFDTSGTLIWATYYGGSGTENCFGITCDKDNNVFIGGYTSSTAGIATTGAHQTVRASSSDCFLAKFNSSGALKWATYYGGTGVDRGLALSCDTNKNVYMAGYTQSISDIATTGAHQTSLAGGQDAFIVQFDSTGVRLWGSYYGGSANDQGLGVACDDACQPYITGYTLSSSGMATTGAHQTVFGGGSGMADGFLAKFDHSGNLKWSTYYGGISSDISHAVTCDHLGNLYIAGGTTSDTGIATVGAFKDTLDIGDGFVAKFDTSGVRHWGTYFGGESDDGFYSIYLNYLSKLFLSGMTNSNTNLSTTGSHQTSLGGGSWDVFLAKFDDCQLVAPLSITGTDTVCRSSAHTYSVPTVTGAISYTWTLPSGWTGTSTTNSITVTIGTTTDTIRVAANFACGTSTQTKMEVVVDPLPTIMPSGTLSHCSGDSTTLTASAGTAYQWLEGGIVIAGAMANTYVAHTANTYAVIVTSLNGCIDTSLSDTLVVHPSPTPVITASGTVLSTGSYANYQWYHDGTPITGANGDTYTMLVLTGNYTVTVIDTNGCTGTSAPYSPTTAVHETPSTKELVRVYPNPLTDWLYIETDKPVTISIKTIDGKTVFAKSSAYSKVNLSDYAEGLYLLYIYNDEGALIVTEKLIKYNSR